jgi:hypothetical protein
LLSTGARAIFDVLCQHFAGELRSFMPAPNYKVVFPRLTLDYHNLLRENAKRNKRSVAAEAGFLLEAALNGMRALDAEGPAEATPPAPAKPPSKYSNSLAEWRKQTPEEKET